MVTAGNSSVSAQDVLSTTTNTSTITFTDRLVRLSLICRWNELYVKLTDPDANTSSNSVQSLNILVKTRHVEILKL